MRIRYFLLVCILFFITTFTLFPQEIKEIEFRNQLITDILLALAEMTGKSIIPDETVYGKASYFFSETDFETALKIFLQTYKLYYKKEDDIYYVSKIHTEYDPSSQTITMDAEDVEIPYLIRSVSKAIDKTLLYDTLPPEPVTIHIKDVLPEKLINIIMKRFPNYHLEIDKDYYYIKSVVEKPEVAGLEKPRLEGITIKKEHNTYSITADKARFSEILDELFSKADYEYSLLMKRDQLIDKIRFSNKSFDQLLRIILEQANADYKKIGEIYYIFEITQKDVLKKLKSTVRIPLVHLAVQEIPKLFPPDLASSKLYTLDKETNSVILSGSIEEIGPIQIFLKELDKPKEGQQYYRFDLNYLDIKNLKSILPSSFKYDMPIIIPNTKSFVILLSPERKEVLGEYLKLVDINTEGEHVKLKYIRAEYLKRHLPPSVSREDIIETGDPSTVFIKGSPEKLEAFYRELEVHDRPVPQIRYVLLVIQYQEGEALNWNQNIADNMFVVRKPAEEGGNAFLGSIGKVFNLSFDIVSNFGYQFAVKLNLDLSEDKARVLADTTLNGISGEEIRFQNTSTFRYREYEVDPNTGELLLTGVVREITSGLIIKIKGWVSGDGMITMDVDATVSRQGTDVSADVTKPPTTFEKILQTHVRSPSGEPIVIGGLITEENGTTIQKIPVLGDIPLLGYLFQSRKETVDRSEFVIYIVPYAEFPEIEEVSIDMRMERLYYKYF